MSVCLSVRPSVCLSFDHMTVIWGDDISCVLSVVCCNQLCAARQQGIENQYICSPWDTRTTASSSYATNEEYVREYIGKTTDR